MEHVIVNHQHKSKRIYLKILAVLVDGGTNIINNERDYKVEIKSGNKV